MSWKEKQLKVRKPVCDTGLSAQKSVSLQGFASFFSKTVRDTEFLAEKGVSRQNKKGQKNRMRKYNRGRRGRKKRKEKRDKR